MLYMMWDMSGDSPTMADIMWDICGTLSEMSHHAVYDVGHKWGQPHCGVHDVELSGPTSEATLRTPNR